MDWVSSHFIMLRQATDADVPAATLILRRAARWMMDSGKHQWTDSYPTEEHVRADVERGVGYVLMCDSEIVGYCAMVIDGEPAYDSIRGEWLSSLPYLVVHRMAVSIDRKGTGLGRIFMEYIEHYALRTCMPSIRIDTNYDNDSMLGLLRSLDYTYCGEITYDSGTRLAFEKLLT